MFNSIQNDSQLQMAQQSASPPVENREVERTEENRREDKKIENEKKGKR